MTDHTPPYYPPSGPPAPPPGGWPPPQPPAQQPKPVRSAYSIVALIVAIIGFGLNMSDQYGAGALFGAIAVGCGIYGLVLVSNKTHAGRGLAIWGLIIGGFVILASLGGTTKATSQAATAAPITVSSTTASPATRTWTLPAQNPAPPPADPIVIQAKKFGDEYEANQIAAERKWGGKFVQFTAPVGNINSSGVAFHEVTTKFSFTQISCRVKDENQLLNLAKGRPATVRGIVGDDQLMGVISINDCEVVG